MTDMMPSLIVSPALGAPGPYPDMSGNCDQWFLSCTRHSLLVAVSTALGHHGSPQPLQISQTG